MHIEKFEQSIKKISKETGFVLGDEIYRGTSYCKDNIRNIMMILVLH